MDPTQNLNGFPGPLADEWSLDLGFLHELPAGPGSRKGRASYRSPHRIEALLASPLRDLPEPFKQKDTP